MRTLDLSPVPDPVIVVWRALAAQNTTWLVGGAVRDLSLGLTPTDYDLGTAVPPDQVLRWADGAHFRVAAAGKVYGSVRLERDGVTVDVTTFRHEAGYADGRHPTRVTWTADGMADLGRRDFTVNAMAATLAGAVIDPWGGIPDGEARLLRMVGDPCARIAEDRLRGVRAVRFLAYAPGDWTWAPDLARCLERYGPDLCAVGPQRLATEWRAMLPRPFVARAVDAGAQIGLWPSWPSGAPTLAAVQTPAERLALMNLLGFDAGLPDSAWPRAWIREAHALTAELDRGRAAPERAARVAHLAAVLNRPWRPAAIDGRRLMDLLDLPPGPTVGAMLHALDVWAASQDQTPEDGAVVAEARRLLGRMRIDAGRR